MTANEIKFEKKQLKHTNYKNGIHKYSGMTTVADNTESEIPESVIRVLYRIFIEAVSEGIENESDTEK